MQSVERGIVQSRVIVPAMTMAEIISPSRLYAGLIWVFLCGLLCILLGFITLRSPLVLLICLVVSSTFTVHAVAGLGVSSPIICRIRLIINDDVTLIYKSWWPGDLSYNQVKTHAIDSAISSAETWYRSRGLYPKRMTFAASDALKLTGDYLTVKANPDTVENTCAICLDSPEAGHYRSFIQCCHTFHETCISEWFARGRLICPSCRGSVYELIPQSVFEAMAKKSSPSIEILSTEVVFDSHNLT